MTTLTLKNAMKTKLMTLDTFVDKTWYLLDFSFTVFALIWVPGIKASGIELNPLLTRLAFEEMFVNRLWVLKEGKRNPGEGVGFNRHRNIKRGWGRGVWVTRQLLRSFDSKAGTNTLRRCRCCNCFGSFV